IALGELVDGLAMLGGFFDDAILNVGQVHDLRHPVALLDEHSPEQVLEEKRPKVTNVGVVVDGGPAGVHPNVARLDGQKLFELATHRVVEADGRHLISRSSTTAWAASASPLPIGPMWSVVVAFRPTAAGSMSSTPARLVRIASRYGASRGTWASSVTSTFSTAHLARRQWSATSRSKSRLRASLYFGSSSGKSVPMSPMPAAPQSASISAWQITSASLCPCSPISQGNSTPPSTSRRPTTNRWRSKPLPTRTSGRRQAGLPPSMHPRGS